MSETTDQNVITTQPKPSEDRPEDKEQTDTSKEAKDDKGKLDKEQKDSSKEAKDEKSKLETGKGCVDAFKDMFHQIAAICMHSTVLYRDLKKDCEEGGCFSKCNCYAESACCGDDGCLEKLCYGDKSCCSEGCDNCFSDGCCNNCLSEGCYDCGDCDNCCDCGCDDCCDWECCED